VLIKETAFKRGFTEMGISFPNFLDWRTRNHVFEDIATYQGANFSLTGAGEPEQLRGARVSHGLFEILRVLPLNGQTFTADEDRPDQNGVVLLGHGLWQSRFGSDPNIVGRQVLLNNRSHIVKGVMPPGFKFPEIAELWVPLALDTKLWTRNDHGLGGVARLKDGISFSQAQAEMDVIARQIEEENPVTNEGLGVGVTNMHTALAGDYREGLLILLGVVTFVLLVACANVANLMLARAIGRQKEVAVRAALGASRWRIVRQLLTESLLLGAAGGALGLLLARWGLDLLLAAIPFKLPFWMNFGLDLRVLGFTLVVSLLTGLIFGIAPALQASHSDLNETLKEGGRSAAGVGRNRSRNVLVVVEIALSLVLLVGAGLMMASFLRLQQVDPGLNPKGVLTMGVALPQAKYREPEQRSQFFRQLIENVRALPGVEAAAATSNLPLTGGRWGRSLTVEGYPILSVGQAPMIQHTVVMPGYFTALGIPVLQGRDFSETDGVNAPKVTIIDERLAREYWPNVSPLGKRIRFGPPEDNEPWHTVVGVVGAVRHSRLDVDTDKIVYLPHLQIPVNGLALVVRAAANPESLAGPVRSKVREIDPDLPVVKVITMEDVVGQSVWQPRLYSILFGIFAVVALLLATVGIYGVMSYTVTTRTREFGVRMALGAQSGDLLRLIMGQGMRLAFLGIVIGLLGAFALTRLLKNLLFEVTATDPLTFALITALLTLVVLAACWLPARRATKVDPLVALRYE
jgi:putative ABC transport system permease protein